MSKHTFVKELRKEIAKLNEEIDRRIIQGRSYKALGERHKILVRKLNTVTRYPSSSYSFLGRLNHIVSTLAF